MSHDQIVRVERSALCNKRSNKKECGINKKERGILQALA